MKTPRQILLESHRAAEPRLDRVREAVLATEFSPPVGRRPVAALLQKMWLELIWPSRHVWAGLAAVWVALAALYLSAQRPGDSHTTPPNPQMMADWMQEQQLLAQLLDRPTPKTAEAPPPPRTQPAGTPPLKSAQWLADETTAWA